MSRTVMEFVHIAAVVLGLLAVGHSAPVNNCDALTKPLEFQRDQLMGKWIFIAESTEIPGSQLLTKMLVANAWLKVSAQNEDNGLSVVNFYKMANLCFTLSANNTVANNTISSVHPFAASSTLLKTSCPDCLVILGKYPIGERTLTTLQLMSRRSKVTVAELDEFKKQVECLNLQSPAFMDPEKGFCSDDSSNQGTGNIDMTDSLKSRSSEILSAIDTFLSSEGGVQTFIKMMSSSIEAIINNNNNK